jgi:hypothetical protein
MDGGCECGAEQRQSHVLAASPRNPPRSYRHLSSLVNRDVLTRGVTMFALSLRLSLFLASPMAAGVES